LQTDNNRMYGLFRSRCLCFVARYRRVSVVNAQRYIYDRLASWRGAVGVVRQFIWTPKFESCIGLNWFFFFWANIFLPYPRAHAQNTSLSYDKLRRRNFTRYYCVLVLYCFSAYAGPRQDNEVWKIFNVGQEVTRAHVLNLCATRVFLI
jgi:hypothetical protein